jgi:hypothetical protein
MGKIVLSLNPKLNSMKNVYLIPTDKPSRLYKHNELGFELLAPVEHEIGAYNGSNQNIHITNDEEIEEGDIDSKVCIFKSGNGIITCLAGKGYGRVKTFGKYYEVILTTDQDLIKDGVQAIDDNFLQWFVKNPSCDEVELNKGSYELSPME